MITASITVHFMHHLVFIPNVWPVHLILTQRLVLIIMLNYRFLMESWSLCIALDVLDGSIRPSWEIRIMNDGILKLSSNK